MALAESASPSSAARLIVPVWYTGSGREYFRIWAVDLLLTVVTLSLYAPFARARRLTYFYGNTLVGYDTLQFDGDPWKMMRRHLLMVGLAITTWAVFRFVSPLAWRYLALLALTGPALWRASLRLRVGHTSWRGVRLSFHGGLAGAYLCVLPFLVPLLALLLMLPPLPQVPRWPPQPGLLACLVMMLACLPWTLARIASYLQSGCAFAWQRSQLDLRPWAFYKLSLKALALALPCMLVLGKAPSTAKVVAVLAILWLLLHPYIISRQQNLVWSHTRSQRLRFRSRLRWSALCRLQVSNAIRILLTLGLYWPYARVRTARLRLESISVQIEGDVDQWQSRVRAAGPGALGEDSVDFLGIDVGA